MNNEMQSEVNNKEKTQSVGLVGGRQKKKEKLGEREWWRESVRVGKRERERETITTKTEPAEVIREKNEVCRGRGK